MFFRLLFTASLAAYSVLAQNIAIRHATVYAAPDTAPEQDSTVLVMNGRIVGVREHVHIPAATRSIDCQKCIVTAGFWNAHVHFTEQKWEHAETAADQKLTHQLQNMLLRSGFMTVVDTGSNPINTTNLRKRIDSGTVKGPRIFTAGSPLYPPNGIPYYLGDVPPEIRRQMPQPDSPEEAAAAVRKMHAMGADISASGGSMTFTAPEAYPRNGLRSICCLAQRSVAGVARTAAPETSAQPNGF